MANRVADKSLSIDQSLHGYSAGHSMIASSMKLKSRDLKLMLILSDASGPSASIPEDGYITGYPLIEESKYVLAQTWAAPEMDRPGCVWTHSLLIEFSDLAKLRSLYFLRALFHRPSGSSVIEDRFDKRLAVQESEPFRISNELIVHARRIETALYGRPEDRIIASNFVGSFQVVDAIWAQQWPKLRRSFRFCTLSFADRSAANFPFDLQIVPAQRSIRARFAKAVDVDSVQRK
jgi:hypothetical protein